MHPTARKSLICGELWPHTPHRPLWPRGCCGSCGPAATVVGIVSTHAQKLPELPAGLVILGDRWLRKRNSWVSCLVLANPGVRDAGGSVSPPPQTAVLSPRVFHRGRPCQLLVHWPSWLLFPMWKLGLTPATGTGGTFTTAFGLGHRFHSACQTWLSLLGHEGHSWQGMQRLLPPMAIGLIAL